MAYPVRDCECEDFPCCVHADNFPHEVDLDPYYDGYDFDAYYGVDDDPDPYAGTYSEE